jgi:F-type H+-transporting ATPase subunit b
MKLDLWTLGLQTVNVLVLAWLLHRFLFKPVTAAIARRQAATARTLAEANAARDAAETQRKALEAERAELAAGRETLLAEARVAAHAERDVLLERASAEVARRAEDARAALQLERRDAESALSAQTCELAVSIARRLLERLPRRSVLNIFLDDTCTALSTLPDEQRRVLLDHDASGGLQIVTADALSPDEQTQCHERLAATLGPSMDISFIVDPNLLAGVELRFRHFVVRNSWAHDLDCVLDALKKDGNAGPNT